MGRRKTRRDDANGTFLSQHLAIPSLRVEGLGFIRPRFLAVAFFGFFASVAYLAYSFAHQASQGAYSPEISRAVYQTSMLGGVLVLIGLFLTASILPHLARAWGPRGSTSSRGG